jgi:transposase
MAEQERMKVLTDAQWDQLAPLIEACRPHGKTEPQDLRRTIEAIIWRHENGAKWRSIPAELGPWWMAAQMFTAGVIWGSGNVCWSWRNSVVASKWG